MRAGLFSCLCLLAAASAHAQMPAAENYGVGVICPRSDSQITFYTENDQQDAAGTIGIENGAFVVTSEHIRSLKSAGAHEMQSLCDNAMPGIRIDTKRDGWLQAGSLWIPPNQEWDYGDWQDFLHKVAIWKPIVPFQLFEGTNDAPNKDRPYAQEIDAGRVDIYPLKFTEGYALVVVDEAGAFAKSCAGLPQPPRGFVGWMRTSLDNGGPVAVPAHLKGCGP